MNYTEIGIISAYTYSRVPNDNDYNLASLKAHLQKLQRACTDRNVVVLRPYYDVRSGPLADRPGFRRLLEDAILERPAYIVVPELSVALRRIDEPMRVMAVLEGSGTKLVSAGELFGEPPEDFTLPEEPEFRLAESYILKKHPNGGR